MSSGEPAALSYGRPPHRRGFTLIVRIAKYLALAVVGIILALVVAYRACTWYFPHQARSEAIAAFSKARTLEECKPNLKLGTWLQMKDGSWIAIRYQDSHNLFWSVSVAIDSSGNWYESDAHFCGQFIGHQRTKQVVADGIAALRKHNATIPSDLESQLTAGPLYEIERSPDLESAIPKLLKMGFGPMTIPRKQWPPSGRGQ